MNEKDELLKKMDAMQKELKTIRKAQVEEKSQAQLEKDWEHYRKEKRKKNIKHFFLSFSLSFFFSSSPAFQTFYLLVVLFGIYLAFKG